MCSRPGVGHAIVLLPEYTTSMYIKCGIVNMLYPSRLLKNTFRRHSERSEESLFGGDPRKERFLTSQTPFGMKEWCFFLKVLKLRTENLPLLPPYSYTPSRALLQCIHIAFCMINLQEVVPACSCTSFATASPLTARIPSARPIRSVF